MEDEDFFEHFRKKDFSSVKKFKFKRTRNIESSKDVSSVNDNGLFSEQDNSNSFPIRKKDNDTILDTLYKNTLSNKSGIGVKCKNEDLEGYKNANQYNSSGETSAYQQSKLSLNENMSTSKYFNLGKPTIQKDLKDNSLSGFKKLLDTKNSFKLEESKELTNEQIVENDKSVTTSVLNSTKAKPPVRKQKKFTFKNTLNKSECTKTDESNNSFDNLLFENKIISTEDLNPINERCLESPNFKKNLSITNESVLNDGPEGETCSLDCDTRNQCLKSKENDDVMVSQSVGITDEDYMDDEEFERRFGNLAEQFEDSDVTLKQNIVEKISQDSSSSLGNDDHNTNQLLNEISNINWDDNFSDEEPVHGSFKDRNDDSAEFKGVYEHSEIMMEVLQSKFGLRSFRPHQREVINASLKQHDCFVLMPTGGGKSLCYQLPAILMPGVTIVISPLRALMSDQVDKLNALDICSAHLGSDVSKIECDKIYVKLSTREPAIKLLYLTPEKIYKSRAITDILDSLYQRGKLARFVIDEVHCLSQWGHDFRPDYVRLSTLREKYPEVPIICLTATATKQVEQDVIRILNLRNLKRFIRSFNRPNIKYQVIPKHKTQKNSAEVIANLIKTKFQKMSGIVYCLYRKDCDTLAEIFNKLGIRSKPYHAGLSDKVREAIQREWMQDRFYVIVATIAFGMGIDKPDVRFVIHNSVPKSVESFYQESGRAGRDGEVSYSYLFYSWSDVEKLMKLMALDKSAKHVLEGHYRNLMQMVGFVENALDCRRHLQLIHLGEHFDRRICIKNKATTCDNCENIGNYQSVDFTRQAKELCAIVKDFANRDMTTLAVLNVYGGCNTKNSKYTGQDSHPSFGAGADMDKEDIMRILKQLMIREVLFTCCKMKSKFPVVVVTTGPKFYQFFNSDCKLLIPMRKDGRSESGSSGTVAQTIQRNKNRATSREAVKPTTSTVVRHTEQKQATAKLQAVRKLQLNQLKTRCHEDLLEECRRLAMERNLTLSSIMNLSAFKNMSNALPSTKEEMLNIQHVTNANYSKYGEYFLKITQKYREQHDALLPLTEASKIGDDDDDDEMSDTESDFRGMQAGGCQRGTKRKSNWGGKARTFKGKKTFFKKRKKSSPKGKSPKNSGWKGKSSKSAGGGLGLMPIHYK